MTNIDMTVFVLGFAFGGTVFWQVSKVVERFRRARADFRATRKGLRTLVEMMAQRLWQAVEGTVAGIIVVAVVAIGWWYSNR